MDDNIFDDDEALDYIIYDDCEKRDKQNNADGCLSTVIIFLIPFAIIALSKIA